ncbi:small multi-drug export protein [Methanocalculus sp.]|uniref:small multi-drug export protein n=1 Tax=Methanocalculus sp. TaxID=2004547 RepID=UPI00271F8E21|nr:small multi-drug export protein [Methanocalculus sp.]MDO8841443.1 small multi-drug export protein [Methanocalculus sp.]
MQVPDQDTYPFIGALVPFLLLLIYIVLSSFLLPTFLFITLLSVIVAYLVSPIGRWVIPIAIVAGLPWWYAGFTIFLIDTLGALFMAWNFRYLFGLPGIGSYMVDLISKVESLLAENPWMERFTAATLLMYVTLPIQGAGSLMGSIIGRLIGISPWKVFWIMVTGGVIGSFGMALGSDALRIFLIGNIAIGLAIMFIGILAFIIGYLSYRAIRRRRL